MNRILKTGALGLMILATVPACTNRYDPFQRAAGGALIGAGSGAAIGAAAAGGSGAALGAAVGGLAGGLAGYATTPERPRAHSRSSQRDDSYAPPPPPDGY
jgi:hypothetical protein